VPAIDIRSPTDSLGQINLLVFPHRPRLEGDVAMKPSAKAPRVRAVVPRTAIAGAPAMRRSPPARAALRGSPSARAFALISNVIDTSASDGPALRLISPSATRGSPESRFGHRSTIHYGNTAGGFAGVGSALRVDAGWRKTGPVRQGSGHGERQAGSLDRLTWLFVAMGRLLLALGAPKLM
jgi:hypothetical protein